MNGDKRDEPRSDEKLTTGLGDYLTSGEHATKFTFDQPQWTGTGALLDEPVLLVEQRAGLLETSGDYEIKSTDGDPLGSVRQVDQSQARQLVRAFSKFDKYMTHKFEVLDADGNVVLRLTRPAKLRKSKILVEHGAGNEVGRIKGKSRSDWDFVVTDADDNEVGRITKSFAGLSKAFLKGDDNYVVGMHRRLDDPLRLLVVAAGVGIDTALHLDD